GAADLEERGLQDLPEAGRAGGGIPQQALEGRYPYLWVDAKVEKVGCVVGKCLVLAYGVHESGYREAIAPRASVSVIRRTRRRITMASSASASTWPIPFGRRIGSPGP